METYKQQYERTEISKTVYELMARFPGISDEAMAQRASELVKRPVSTRRIAQVRGEIKRGVYPRLNYAEELAQHGWPSYRSRPFS